MAYSPGRCSTGKRHPQLRRTGDLSQALLHPSLDRLQSPCQFRWVVASGLGHIRPASALPAHLLGDEIDELAGDEAHLPVLTRAEHDRCCFQLALQTV